MNINKLSSMNTKESFVTSKILDYLDNTFHLQFKTIVAALSTPSRPNEVGHCFDTDILNKPSKRCEEEIEKYKRIGSLQFK